MKNVLDTASYKEESLHSVHSLKEKGKNEAIV